MMTFKTIKPQSGLLTYGQPSEWDWTRKGGHYFAYRDFFCVHWEVHHPDDNPDFVHSVRLHVESPKYDKDLELNEIKRQIVEALLTAELEEAAEEGGFSYKKGRLTSLASIRKNQCTEAFRVTLPTKQRGGTPAENIRIVHRALGSEIKTVIEPFIETLNLQFGIPK
jgi:hypothetical protein